MDSLDSQKLRNDLYNAVILQAEAGVLELGSLFLLCQDLPEVARGWAKRAREEGFWRGPQRGAMMRELKVTCISCSVLVGSYIIYIY